MGKVFVRIDDRLIHGQIVAAWCLTLGVKEIIAIDDSLASNPMLQSIMTMGVPAQYNPKIVTSMQARELLKNPIDGNRLVITRFCRNLAEISDEIKGCDHINVGNCSKQDDSIYTIPSGAGRYLYLTKADMEALDKEAADGVTIMSQLLPSEKMKTWQALRNGI